MNHAENRFYRTPEAPALPLANITPEVSGQSYAQLARDWDAVDMHEALPEHVQALVMRHYRAYAETAQMALEFGQ